MKVKASHMKGADALLCDSAAGLSMCEADQPEVMHACHAGLRFKSLTQSCVNTGWGPRSAV